MEFTNSAARLFFVKAVCAVAEGATVTDAMSCLGAIFSDAAGRFTTLGGQAGMARSLGSVYAGAVTLFLGRSFRNVVKLTSASPHYASMAVTRNGASVVCADVNGPELGVLQACDATRVSGCFAVYNSRLATLIRHYSRSEFDRDRLWRRDSIEVPSYLCVAPDGVIYAVCAYNQAIYGFHPTTFEEQEVLSSRMFRNRKYARGICADADLIAVAARHGCGLLDSSPDYYFDISIVDRKAKTLLRTITDGYDLWASQSEEISLCFVNRSRLIAAVRTHHQITLCTVEGAIVRHIITNDEIVEVHCVNDDELIAICRGSITVLNLQGEVLRNFAQSGSTYLRAALNVRNRTIVLHHRDARGYYLTSIVE